MELLHGIQAEGDHVFCLESIQEDDIITLMFVITFP